MPEVKFKKACSDCPFRRDSTPGWCGASEPEWFTESALTDFADYDGKHPDGDDLAPCHQTVDYTDPEWRTKLDDAAACAGALAFAANNFKSPRNPVRQEAVATVGQDPEVFRYPDEFHAHHRQPDGMFSWDPSLREAPTRVRPRREDIRFVGVLVSAGGRAETAAIARSAGVETRTAAAALGRLEDAGLVRPVPQGSFPRGLSGNREWEVLSARP